MSCDLIGEKRAAITPQKAFHFTGNVTKLFTVLF